MESFTPYNQILTFKKQLCADVLNGILYLILTRLELKVKTREREEKRQKENVPERCVKIISGYQKNKEKVERERETTRFSCSIEQS